MIFLRALGITLSVILTVIIIIAMVYIAMWFTFGIAAVLLFLSIYHLLQAKSKI